MRPHVLKLLATHRWFKRHQFIIWATERGWTHESAEGHWEDFSENVNIIKRTCVETGELEMFICVT